MVLSKGVEAKRGGRPGGVADLQGCRLIGLSTLNYYTTVKNYPACSTNKAYRIRIKL